jgi:hypothetical protein
LSGRPREFLRAWIAVSCGAWWEIFLSASVQEQPLVAGCLAFSSVQKLLRSQVGKVDAYPLSVVKSLNPESGVAMHQRYDESTANLKELMTIAPISHQEYEAHRRAKVDTRRQMEDAREEARQRSEEVL